MLRFLWWWITFVAVTPGTPGTAGAADGSPTARAIEEKATWVMAPGEQRTAHFASKIRKFSAGSSAIRVVRPLGEQDARTLLVKAVAAGFSDLWVTREDGSVEHRKIEITIPEGEGASNETKGLQGLREALGALDEAQVTRAGNHVAIHGVIRELSEARRIAALTLAFPGSVVDQTEWHESLRSLIRSQLERLIDERKQAGEDMSALRVTELESRLQVSGRLPDPRRHAALVASLRKQAPGVIINLTELKGAQPTVLFRVVLMEVRREEFQRLGIAWPEAVEGAFRASPSALHSALEMTGALQAAAGRGGARVLAEPELVVRAQGSAELFAGGEYPVRTHDRFHTNVHWKPYGLSLKLKVPESSEDLFRLELSVEVSQLNPKIQVDEVPGIQTNRVQTVVDAQFGVPLFLCGLLQSSTREQVKGIPGLMEIPILGALFSSREFLEERSELVTVLWPHLKPPEVGGGFPKLFRLDPLPKGPVPARRAWIDPSRETTERKDPAFPWNVLND